MDVIETTSHASWLTTHGCCGYPVGTGAILHHHEALIETLNGQLRLPSELQPLFNITLDRLANWLHLLPAHPQHHCEPAGALRHCLEIALWSVAATEQIHFDNDLYPDQQRARQPVWRLMAAVTGLLYDSGRIVSCITVNHPDGGQWSALQYGLGDWLQRHRIHHYTPHWQHCDQHPEQPLSSEYTWINLVLLNHLMSDALRDVLKPDHDKGVLWQTFISGLTGQKSPLAVDRLVSAIEQSRQKSIQQHSMKGEALTQPVGLPIPPVEQENSSEESNTQEDLKTVVAQLESEQIKWVKDCLILKWPDDLKTDTLTAKERLALWHQRNWIKSSGNNLIVCRNGQQCVFLKPAISEQCKQWLPAAESQ